MIEKKISSTRRILPEVVTLEGDNTHLANLCGLLDENLRQLADGLGVTLSRQGDRVTLEGEHAELAARALRRFHYQACHKPLGVDDVQLGLVEIRAALQTAHDAQAAAKAAEAAESQPTAERNALPPVDDKSDTITLCTRRSDLRPRSPRQRDYLNNILKHDITFGVGPAGTGKTWLAVACA